MSLKTNGGVSFLDNAVDLGFDRLTATDVHMASGETDTSVDIRLPGKCTMIALVDLVSGELKVDVDYFVAGASHNFSSPFATLTINSTTSGNTVKNYLAVDFAEAGGANSMGVKLTPGSSGTDVHEALFIVVTEREAGEDWNGGIEALHNAVLSTKTGDGSGIVPRGPAATRGVPTV